MEKGLVELKRDGRLEKAAKRSKIKSLLKSHKGEFLKGFVGTVLLCGLPAFGLLLYFWYLL